MNHKLTKFLRFAFSVEQMISGLDQIVTQALVAAIRRTENHHRILEFMVSGQIITTALTLLTVIRTTLLI